MDFRLFYQAYDCDKLEILRIPVLTARESCKRGIPCKKKGIRNKMNKRITAAVCAIVMAAATVAGCGKKDPTHLSGINAADYVDLCDYKGIEVQEAEPSVSDEYEEYYINYLLQQNATTEEITDRDTVADGDIANIDYVGKVDGKEFDGGSAKGYDLTIGSGTFIDGFEDGLIGKKVGSTVTLNLKFPDDYSNEDLKGKAVTFDVTINKISKSVVPTLDDDYVAKQDINGVTTVDEYKKYIRSQLMDQAQQTYESDIEQQIREYLLDNCKFKQDPPKEMVDNLYSRMIEYYTSSAQQYGMELSNYMQYYGYSADTYEDEVKDSAQQLAKENIILQAIADKENLNPSKTELSTEYSKVAAELGYDSVREFRKNEDEEIYKENLMMDKVMKFLRTNAKVTEPTTDNSSDSSSDTSSDSSSESSEASTEETGSTEASTENTEASTGESAEASTESAETAAAKAETTASTEAAASGASDTEAATEKAK